MKIYKLERPNCSQCRMMEVFMQTAKGKEISGNIEVLTQSKDKDKFLKYLGMATDQGYMSFPFIVAEDGTVLHAGPPDKPDYLIQKVKEFRDK